MISLAYNKFAVKQIFFQSDIKDLSFFFYKAILIAHENKMWQKVRQIIEKANFIVTIWFTIQISNDKLSLNNKTI